MRQQVLHRHARRHLDSSCLLSLVVERRRSNALERPPRRPTPPEGGIFPEAVGPFSPGHRGDLGIELFSCLFRPRRSDDDGLKRRRSTPYRSRCHRHFLRFKTSPEGDALPRSFLLIPKTACLMHPESSSESVTSTATRGWRLLMQRSVLPPLPKWRIRTRPWHSPAPVFTGSAQRAPELVTVTEATAFHPGGPASVSLSRSCHCRVLPFLPGEPVERLETRRPTSAAHYLVFKGRAHAWTTNGSHVQPKSPAHRRNRFHAAPGGALLSRPVPTVPPRGLPLSRLPKVAVPVLGTPFGLSEVPRPLDCTVRRHFKVRPCACAPTRFGPRSFRPACCPVHRAT